MGTTDLIENQATIIAALRQRLSEVEDERDQLKEELGIHVDLTVEPFTEAELAQVDDLRAKMKRTVEEYDITKAVERAERAEAERDEAIRSRDEGTALIARYGFDKAKQEIASLRSDQERMREALETMRAALEILNSGGGLGYAKHALIAAALSSTPTPEQL